MPRMLDIAFLSLPIDIQEQCTTRLNPGRLSNALLQLNDELVRLRAERDDFRKTAQAFSDALTSCTALLSDLITWSDEHSIYDNHGHGSGDQLLELIQRAKSITQVNPNP